mmetsp:Transcript_31339/g.91124  ORF Transcript_31339/g.91124 Transcript_31339/m.91124 type:complete len:262 (-) Transcript_31339:1072-1857(-)
MVIHHLPQVPLRLEGLCNSNHLVLGHLPLGLVVGHFLACLLEIALVLRHALHLLGALLAHLFQLAARLHELLLQQCDLRSSFALGTGYSGGGPRHLVLEVLFPLLCFLKKLFRLAQLAHEALLLFLEGVGIGEDLLLALASLLPLSTQLSFKALDLPLELCELPFALLPIRLLACFGLGLGLQARLGATLVLLHVLSALDLELAELTQGILLLLSFGLRLGQALSQLCHALAGLCGTRGGSCPERVVLSLARCELGLQISN